MKTGLTFLLLCLGSLTCFSAKTTFSGFSALEDLSDEFWTWRAVNQPLSGDDITRIERPKDWVPDWSPPAVTSRQKDLRAFQKRWQAIEVKDWPVNRQVDHRLMGVALARVEWELSINPGWRKNPLFYIDQTLGAVFEILLPPPPFDEQRSREIILRLEQIPKTLDAARKNLDQPIRPFAELAIAELEQAGNRLETVGRELQPLLTTADGEELPKAVRRAVTALESYQEWLRAELPTMSTQTAVGREAYLFFLRRVALLPYSPEELVSMARQEWERAVTFEVYEKQRNRKLPALPLAGSRNDQIEKNSNAEAEVRGFLNENGILSVPDGMPHYRNAPLPAYLAPLAHLGVIDDLTGPSRLDQDGVKYIPAPAPGLGYFNLATAKDPRPILIHEGVPGHYFQLARSWTHPKPLRRNYFDSGPNEGIGFYAEEMMLQAGYFDNSPRTREIIYNFMRLRALRVEVDVKLATGEFSIEQAGAFLAQMVPMDAETARDEAAFFATAPGQAISYQIGKLQICQFLADARMQKGEKFNLQRFHDFLWLNGNVPLALQRWEYLGLDDQIKKLDGR